MYYSLYAHIQYSAHNLFLSFQLLDDIQSLEYDWKLGFLYWTSSSQNSILALNLSSTDSEASTVLSGRNSPRELVVSAADG